MRVPLSWLAEWIELPGDRELLLSRLTLAGLEIESEERTRPDLSEIVVGEVLACEPHPDADRLSVCRVGLGGGEPLTIVCGAPNVGAGQKVAVARPGTRLPDGTRIRRVRIRGVESAGMICSAQELGLGEQHDGILVLDPTALPGGSLEEVLPPADTVIEVEITPNRGDWCSLLGIAREVRALFGGELRLPPVDPPEVEEPASAAVAIRVEDTAGCHRYVGRVVRDVVVGPSPAWLVHRLEAAGLRAVNNVVDVTNLVLLEFGQPLHAFDLERLADRRIEVRSARAGEKILTLDGEARELGEDDLVIADGRGPVAVAGVMGGADSEVGPETRSVLLEGAHFAPARVRRTARRLGLHTESSYRFERGVDPEGVRRAVDRAARLLAELAGGAVLRGAVEVLGDPPPRTHEILLDPRRVDRLLGTDLGGETMAAGLERLGIRTTVAPDGRLRCQPPSWRNDLHLPEDLAEEVARIHGYDRIPSTLPRGACRPARAPRRVAVAEEARDLLAAAGLIEAVTLSFYDPGDAERLRLPEDDPRRCIVELENPILRDQRALRPTLVPALLRAARRNLDRQAGRVRLFEVARVFRARAQGELPEERLRASGVLAVAEPRGLWEPNPPPPVFFRAKGAVERLLVGLGLRARFSRAEGEPWLHPGAAAEIRVGRERLGVVGELHPATAAAFGIDVPCAVFELDLEVAAAREPTPPQLRPVSNQPAVRRDLALLVDREVAAEELADLIRRRGGDSLISVSVFDRYEGEGVPEGRVSLAFRLVFQRPDRTLTDAEVTGAVEGIVRALEERFGAALR